MSSSLVADITTDCIDSVALFEIYFSPRVSFSGALSECATLAVTSSLARIDSDTQMSAIRSALALDSSSASVWVGASSLNSTSSTSANDFSYTDGVTDNIAFLHTDATSDGSPWNIGEPSAASEQCVEMRENFGFLFNDASCTLRKGFICRQNCQTESPVSSNTPTRSPEVNDESGSSLNSVPTLSPTSAVEDNPQQLLNNKNTWIIGGALLVSLIFLVMLVIVLRRRILKRSFVSRKNNDGSMLSLPVAQQAISGVAPMTSTLPGSTSARYLDYVEKANNHERPESIFRPSPQFLHHAKETKNQSQAHENNAKITIDAVDYSL